MGGRVLLTFGGIGPAPDDLVFSNDESPDWNFTVGGGEACFLQCQLDPAAICGGHLRPLSGSCFWVPQSLLPKRVNIAVAIDNIKMAYRLTEPIRTAARSAFAATEKARAETSSSFHPRRVCDLADRARSSA